MNCSIAEFAISINNSNGQIPNDSIFSIITLKNLGARAYSNLEPSRGENGIKLNTKRPRFTDIRILNRVFTAATLDFMYTHTPKATKAIMKFDIGPATATNATPHSCHFRFFGLKGTGFAPPNTGAPTNAKDSGKMIVKKMSI